jgi:hypothetical protein
VIVCDYDDTGGLTSSWIVRGLVLNSKGAEKCGNIVSRLKARSFGHFSPDVVLAGLNVEYEADS